MTTAPSDRVRVRVADASDAEACAGVYAPFVTDTVVSFEAVPPGPPEMAERIAGARRHHTWLVATVGEQVVGYAYAGPWRSREAYRRTCEVSVYLAADHTGRGVGRALYAVLLPELAARGYHVALAAMTLPNPASEGFHRSFGFTEVGRFRQVGHKAGGWRDVLWMQLVLPPGPG